MNGTNTQPIIAPFTTGALPPTSKVDIEAIMKNVIASDPAWARLRAVQNGQVFYLPSEFFQLNPGIRFHEAVDYMAKAVYPDIYGNTN